MGNRRSDLIAQLRDREAFGWDVDRDIQLMLEAADALEKESARPALPEASSYEYVISERDGYRAGLERIRDLLPGPRTFAESLARDFAGKLWPRTVDADAVAAIVDAALGEEGET